MFDGVFVVLFVCEFVLFEVLFVWLGVVLLKS